MKTKIKNIGKVCVTPKGEFDAENGHEKLDIVSYQDRTFIAKKDAPKGILPTNEEYYMKLPVGEKVAEDAAAFATEQANYAKAQANFATEQGNYAKREADRLSSIDLSLYRVVIDLPNIPSMSDDDKNKIYLKVSAKQGENNKYDEFVVVDNAWELLGQYEAAIDLTDYIGKDELSYEIATLPSLNNISKFICVDSNGEMAGTMTKEQVSSVIAEIIGTVTITKNGLLPSNKFSFLGFNKLIITNKSIAIKNINKSADIEIIIANGPSWSTEKPNIILLHAFFDSGNPNITVWKIMEGADYSKIKVYKRGQDIYIPNIYTYSTSFSIKVISDDYNAISFDDVNTNDLNLLEEEIITIG